MKIAEEEKKIKKFHHFLCICVNNKNYLFAGTTHSIFGTQCQIKSFILVLEFCIDTQRRIGYTSDLSMIC